MKKIWEPVFAFILLSVILFTWGCKAGSQKGFPGMALIEAGEFVIGSIEEDTNALAKEYGSRHGVYFENERPMRTGKLPDFFIDISEVTNSAYKEFVDNTEYRAPDHWRGGEYQPGTGSYPVVRVSWLDADAYCRWVKKRLPTEHEWEKASRGPKGNIYPWGNIFDETKANLKNGKTLPVRSIESDRSYYGIYDLGGNVMEWTASWYKPYEGSSFHSDEFGEKNRVIKGGYGSSSGHYSMGVFHARGSFRNFFKPEGKGFDVGFRCAKGAGTGG